MTFARRTIRMFMLPVCLIAFAGVLSGCAASGDPHAASRPKIARQIAAAYDIDGWSQVDRIAFTFNFENADRRVKRSWVWEPKSGLVTLRAGDDEPISFSLDNVTEEQAGAHHDFINDTYWLLFPYQLVWSDAAVTDSGGELEPAPISGRELRTVSAAYSATGGGYTPGDTYVLYVDDDLLIVEWTFQRPDRPDIPATWNPPEQFGPIKISTRHHITANDGNLYFTEIEVE